MAGRHVFLAPLAPSAEPICLLDPEGASRRVEPSNRFLADASVKPLGNGIEYRFSSDAVTWQRLITYVEEERQCCPFLAFEALEEERGTRLIVFQPYD